SAVYVGGDVRIDGVIVGDVRPGGPLPYRAGLRANWSTAGVNGPAVGAARALGVAEQVALVEAAFTEAGVHRADVAASPRVEAVLLDAASFGGNNSEALAGARVVLGDTGAVERVEVRVAAGDPLDEVVLRSYCIGGAHMALGWVLSEGLAVDPETGEVLDLTIRSFGVIRAKDTPPIEITIVDDAGAPKPDRKSVV